MNFYANILENKGPVIGDDYFLQTKEEIEDWLNEMGITYYNINDNLTINVDNNVDMNNNDLKKIPVQFNIVTGDFVVGNNRLKSLKGCPKIVKGSFGCQSNRNLNTLKYCPEEVGESFNCTGCNLDELDYVPKTIKKDFLCGYNNLTTLEGCPETIEGNFFCNDNQLISLKGCAKTIKGDFLCIKNNIGSFEYFPLVGGNFKLSDNPFKTLDGLENVTIKLLLFLLREKPELDWNGIKWDKVKNLDKIITDLYEMKNVKYSEEALQRMEEAGAY